MYCSACGTAATSGVAYCTSCGNKLIAFLQISALPAPANLVKVVVALVAATTVMGVAGLGITAAIIYNMLHAGADMPATTFVALFFLVTVFGITFRLVGQMSKTLDAYLRSDVIAETPVKLELNPAQAPQLESARTPFVSVVEQTTRNLEKIPR